MKPDTGCYSIVESIPDFPMTLFLIGEELKSRKFFNTLHDLGLVDSYFQPHLDEAILNLLSMNDECDATYDAYYEIMERRSSMIQIGKESVVSQAQAAYQELLDQKGRLAVSQHPASV